MPPCNPFHPRPLKPDTRCPTPGSNLWQQLMARRIGSEAHIADVARALISTVAYCHQNNVMHRDLKLENLLLSDDSDEAVLKVTDFGFSTFLKSTSEQLDDAVGTVMYMAPEMLTTPACYTKQVRAWWPRCGC